MSEDVPLEEQKELQMPEPKYIEIEADKKALDSLMLFSLSFD